MEYLSIIIPSLLYLLFLALGVFIIIQNPERKAIWFFGVSMMGGAIYILFLILSRLDFSPQIAALFTKLSYIPDEIACLFWLLAADELVKESGVGIRLKRQVRYVIYFLNIFFLFLLLFTNVLVDFTAASYIGRSGVEWDFHYKNLYLFRVGFVLLPLVLPAINFFVMSNKSKEIKVKNFSKVLFLSAIVLVIGVIVNQFHVFLRVRNPSFYNFPVYIPETLFLISMSIFGWAVINPNLKISGMDKIIRDFLQYVGYSVFLILPYFLIAFISYKFLDPNKFFVTMILGISGLIIITHSTHEWVVELFRRSIQKGRLVIPVILPSEISEVVRNYSSPERLLSSRLLKLNLIQKCAKGNEISGAHALREIISDSIEYFKPKEPCNKRTAARIKYEILRMMAFEGATESQIMWDLGFDVYTRSVEEKLSETREPRFKLKDPSEYSATSIRSFKRLKKEAIEMLRWRLEEGI